MDCDFDEICRIQLPPVFDNEHNLVWARDIGTCVLDRAAKELYVKTSVSTDGCMTNADCALTTPEALGRCMKDGVKQPETQKGYCKMLRTREY